MSTSLDPVLLEILSQRFRSIAEEMGYALQRTGYTVFVNETADLGVSLVTPQGEIFGYPVDIGVATFCNLDCSNTIAAFDSYEEGDVLITNDAYSSGAMASHLPDVNVMMPVFHEGQLVCFTFAYVHSTDIGGKVPGSISPSSYEVFQEGLRIPPIKLYKAGVLNEDVMRLVLNNCRAPTDNQGDLRAMVTALKVGERRIHEVIARYGRDRMVQAMYGVLDYSEHRARELIAAIPDGSYRFADYLDDDVGSRIPVRIEVELRIEGSNLHLDFAGTDPQVRSAFNIFSDGKPHPWLVYKIAFFLLTLERDIPLNAGILRPVTVSAPPGSVVNCEFPAAIGMRTTTGLRVQDAIFGALAQAMPDVLPAAGAGSVSPLVFAEPNTAEGGLKVTVLEPLVGGAGGHADGDGAHSRDVVDLANMKNNPVEIVEANASVRVLRYGLVPDSAGAGRFRGGCASMLEFEVLTPDATLTPRGMERHRFRPWGLKGGACGQPGSCWVKRNGEDAFQDMHKIDSIHLSVGDVVRLIMPGGAGYGPPQERDPERVRRDVEDGFVSAGGAARDYGVVTDGVTVDEGATRALRTKMPAPTGALFALGPEREGYERLWSAEVAGRFNALLFDLPKAFRAEVRTRLWTAMEARAADGRPTGLPALEEEWERVRARIMPRRGAAVRQAAE